jgi:hypothetical protein
VYSDPQTAEPVRNLCESQIGNSLSLICSQLAPQLYAERNFGTYKLRVVTRGRVEVDIAKLDKTDVENMISCVDKSSELSKTSRRRCGNIPRWQHIRLHICCEPKKNSHKKIKNIENYIYIILKATPKYQSELIVKHTQYHFVVIHSGPKRSILDYFRCACSFRALETLIIDITDSTPSLIFET